MNQLEAYLRNCGPIAIAFSGGVDSSYLLYAAKACGTQVHAYYVHSQFQPQFELDDAKRLAKELDVSMTIIELDVLSCKAVASNPVDRCYHCKREIFGAILAQALKDGYTLLADGSNASDDANDRPGMKALQELKVVSPLRAAGLTKAEIRRLSKEAGLFTWDKPAYACLATRIPTGERIDGQTLNKIENAERILAEMGFADFRARVLGKACKLQLPKAQLTLAARQHEEITTRLSDYFDDVYLDLKPR